MALLKIVLDQVYQLMVFETPPAMSSKTLSRFCQNFGHPPKKKEKKIPNTYTMHPACEVKKSPIFSILLFSFAGRKEAKLQLCHTYASIQCYHLCKNSLKLCG